MKSSGLALTILLFLAWLSGCGGGGGIAALSGDPGGGGIGGTGVTSSGTVSGFGSVFVNGVEFETNEAEIIVNGVRLGEDALGLGMVVTVQGTVNADGVTGNADTVVFDAAVQGPIVSLTRGAHGDVLLLGVLGVDIIVERGATVFEAVSFATLRLNDLVEVSGFIDGEGRLQATRIEKKSDFVSNESEIDRAGLVDNLLGAQFTLGDFTVEFGAADLSSLPGGRVGQGQQVLVSGTLNNTVIAAREIRLVADVGRDLVANEDVVLQGTVTNFDNASQFTVRGVTIDASDAVLELSGEMLDSGLIVQVAGVWNGDILVARSVSSRRARIAVAAPVESVDVEQGTITLYLYNSTMVFRVNAETLIEDMTQQRDRLRLADIVSGDFLLVEALARGATRLALLINRTARGDSVLRAKVEGIVPSAQIVLQGVSINTDGAEFVDRKGSVIDVEMFYDELAIGDIVRATDRQTADGRVDELRIVSDAVLDAVREPVPDAEPGDVAPNLR